MHAAIFDIDGTLLQSDAKDDALYLESIRSALGDVRLRDSWGQYTQFTAAGILGEILLDNDLEATLERVSAVRARFVEGVRRHFAENGAFPEIPGAREFVLNLQASETHRVAYATGGWGASAHLKLSAAGFPLNGIPLASSDDHHERSKIMLIALAQLGDAFESITYYGDGRWDAVAAAELGWRFIPVGPKLGGIAAYRSDA